MFACFCFLFFNEKGSAICPQFYFKKTRKLPKATPPHSACSCIQKPARLSLRDSAPLFLQQDTVSNEGRRQGGKTYGNEAASVIAAGRKTKDTAPAAANQPFWPCLRAA